MTVIRARRNSEMATVTDLEFRQMKKFMKEAFFTCTDEWLLACMNWIKENNRSVNLDVFKREISEQWKDANLTEMESSCLPQALKNQRVVKLPGKYGLQVNSLRDIGESSYSQWNKVKKLENENVSVAATDSTEFKTTWEPKPKRCLHLTMTDGSQEVFGLEMQSIPGLLLTMKPGFKVIIHGPVDCRRGVMHLKPNNIRIIGGEVEDLWETNRMEKILADSLKLSSIPSLTLSQQPTQRVPDVPDTASRNRNFVDSSSSTASSNRTEAIYGEFPDSEDAFPDIGGDDDIFMEIDEEALLQQTEAKSKPQPKPTTSKNPPAPTRSTSQMTTQKVSESSIRLPRGGNQIPTQKTTDNSVKQQSILKFVKPMPMVIDPPTPEGQVIKRRRRSEEQGVPVAIPRVSPAEPIIKEEQEFETSTEDDVPEPNNVEDDSDYVSNNSPPDDSLFRIVDETLESRLLEQEEEPTSSSSTASGKAQKKTFPVKVSGTPFVYLAQVQAQLDDLIQQRKVVRVKACVSTVVSNIKVDGGCWTLCVCINDGTGFLNCKISANILNSIIGFTPSEMKKIKATKTKEGKQKVAEGMHRLAQELVHLNTIFEIELGEQHMITEIAELKLHHLAALKSRLFQLGL